MAAPTDPTPRRPVLFPVVIAGVFLTIIGASVGLVFGSQAAERRAAEQAAQHRPRPPAVVATGSPAASPVPPSRDPAPAATSRRPRPSAVAGPPCRAETERQAAVAGSVRGLRRVLYLQTAASEVWICADAEGRLFYHGHRGGPDDPWVDGENALFLTDVQRDVDGYRARSTGRQGSVTTYLVSRRELVIEHPDGRVEREPATAP